MLELAIPWALLALPLPLLVRRWLPPHRERVSALRVPFFDRVAAAAGAVVLRRRRLQVLVASGVWVLLVLGLAKPQRVGDPIVREEAARDVMLAIDLSGSMDTRDFAGAVTDEKVSRLTGVQRVVDRFVAERETDRIGLIVFGDKAFIQLPFTRDLETARALVELMEVGMAGPQTALGDAIGLSIKAFESSTVDDRIVILLTDGNDTVSRMTPINAAEIARTNGVEIYTIGIGDPGATGDDRVDFGVLSEIASRTGGRFFTAEDEAGLGDVYRRIDEAAVAEVQVQSWRPRFSLVHWPAGAAIGLTLFGYASLWLAERLRRGRA